MQLTNHYIHDLLDFNTTEAMQDRIWRAGTPTTITAQEGTAYITVPFIPQVMGKIDVVDDTLPRREHTLVVRAYGDAVLRVTLALDGHLPDDAASPMLEWDTALSSTPLAVATTAEGWELISSGGIRRMTITTSLPPARHWSDLTPAPPELFQATLYPDGVTAVPFQAYDTFFPGFFDDNSLVLAYVERDGAPHRLAFALHARPQECFTGTGERFAKLDLAGRTLDIMNEESAGVNARRAYKNIPFYLSNLGYGAFLHTFAPVRLSLADLSTRAAQGVIADTTLDLFILGGGTPERILFHYRQLTGFPRPVPLWSYGVWMSRLTYTSADEVLDVAQRLRAADFPCDVLHVDTGWFEVDWRCDWTFSAERFPDPPGFFAAMRDLGYRVSLWQLAEVRYDTKLFASAKAAGHLPSVPPEAGYWLSHASTIDFSHPGTIAWYQGLLRPLLQDGAAVIKTDFGETIEMQALYAGLPASHYHQYHPLAYQRAAFEVIDEVTGTGLIWARSAWAGSQRYPIHWGGDSAGTWDGLAGSLRGGLHLGLSGFAFWSHDVPGHYSVPDFMNTIPPDDLYLRWTQFGVFSSHIRYHGSFPREPYEYPAIADLVRAWWRLRYALIPYLAEQGDIATRTGYPVLRAMALQHPDDPTCWHLDDQFYCGDTLLVAPIMNGEGVRQVYLPAGAWVDLWTGERLSGPQWRRVTVPLAQCPVYAVADATILVYPEAVACTDAMDLTKAVALTFDTTYHGMANSLLGSLTGLAGAGCAGNCCIACP